MFYLPQLVFFCITAPSLLIGAILSVTNSQDARGGSLRQAISDANSNSDSTNTIEITGGLSAIVLESPLPMIDKDLKIQTLSGSQTIDGGSLYRGLVIASGQVETHGLIFEKGKAKGGDGGISGVGGAGGMGGALFVGSGSAVIDASSFSNCTSQGGAGGSFAYSVKKELMEQDQPQEMEALVDSMLVEGVLDILHSLQMEEVEVLGVGADLAQEVAAMEYQALVGRAQ